MKNPFENQNGIEKLGAYGGFMGIIVSNSFPSKQQAAVEFRGPLPSVPCNLFHLVHTWFRV